MSHLYWHRGQRDTDYLKKLIEEEVANKTDRSINAKIAKAKFPQLKTLEMFEFSFQPSVDEKYIRELAHLGFMDKAENIVFLGPPGVGNYRKILLMERFPKKCTISLHQ